MIHRVVLVVLALVVWAEPTSAADQEEPRVRDRVVVVKLAEGAVAGKASDAEQLDVGAEQWRPVFPTEVTQAAKAGAALAPIYYVTYTRDLPPRAVAASFARRDDIAYAEPLYIHTLSRATPDDPRYAAQSHLPLVQAPAGWDVVKGSDGNVVLAVVDSGVDWQHPDLRANMRAHPGETPGNGLDDDGNGFVDDVFGWNFATDSGDPSPLGTEFSHGTEVAGVANAVADNAVGVAGMAWNAPMMGVNASCEGAPRLVCFGYEGLTYAAANGAQVINASWGRAGPFSQFEQDVIDFAHAQGALVVVAAGNDAANNDVVPNFPANYNHVLAVGATFKDNAGVPSFTNYGRRVDVFAPGVFLDSTIPGDAYTPSVAGAFGGSTGTSFAAPLVSALAVLVKTHNPSFSVDEVREQIRVTAQSIDSVNPSFAGQLGRGLIDAERALTVTGSPALRLTDTQLADADGDGLIERGEMITVDATFTAYLADVVGARIEITSDDPRVVVQNGQQAVTDVAQGSTFTGTFSFIVTADTPDEFTVPLAANIVSASYGGTDLFTFEANPSQVVTHDTGALQVSVNSQGNIGWTGFAGTQGEGFTYAGNNQLFEGALLIAAGTGVVDNARDATGAVQKQDFRLADGTELTIGAGPRTTERAEVNLTDAIAEAPLGLAVQQVSYADTRAAYADGFIVQYQLTNTSSETLSDVYAGLLFDWDLGEAPIANTAVFDADRRLGIAQDRADAPTVLAATKLLTPSGLTYRAIDNPASLYDGFTDDEKRAFLTDGLQTTTLGATDLSTLMGSGPFTLEPGCATVVAFAVAGGTSPNGLTATADNLQALWDAELVQDVAGFELTFTQALGATSVEEGSEVRFGYRAERADACGSTGGITYELIGAPENATLNSETGAFRFTPVAGQAGMYEFAVVASNGVRTDTVRSRIDVRLANAAPVFTAALPDTTIAEGQTLAFTFVAQDPEAQPLTYRLDTAPDEATLDAASGAFAFTPTFEQAGLYTVGVEVSDGVKTAASRIALTVTNTNRPPTFDAVFEAPTVAEGSTFAFTLTATDPDGDAVTFAMTDAPAGATLDATTGVFTFSPTFEQRGAYTFQITATDGTDVTELAVTLTVAETNRPPRFTSALPDTTIAEGSVLATTFGATDDDGDAVRFSLAAELANAVVEAETGAFRFAPDFDQAGTYTVGVIASDGSTADTTQARIVVTNTNRPPAFASTLPDTTIAVGVQVALTAVATDPDADPITYSIGGGPPEASIDATTGQLRFVATTLGTSPMAIIASDGTLADTTRFRLTIRPSGVNTEEAPARADALHAPFPNPSAAQATIAYDLAAPSAITLAIYDAAGREVRRLAEGMQASGRHHATWNGRDGSGGLLAAGVYLVRLHIEARRQVLTTTLITVR
ncbi:MAG: S8 family serine peptidase [Bacteroidota bacterium]